MNLARKKVEGGKNIVQRKEEDVRNIEKWRWWEKRTWKEESREGRTKEEGGRKN